MHTCSNSEKPVSIIDVPILWSLILDLGAVDESLSQFLGSLSHTSFNRHCTKLPLREPMVSVIMTSPTIQRKKRLQWTNMYTYVHVFISLNNLIIIITIFASIEMVISNTILVAHPVREQRTTNHVCWSPRKHSTLALPCISI